jgi:hypothetical protein
MGRGGHRLPRVSPRPAMLYALRAATAETFCFNKKETRGSPNPVFLFLLLFSKESRRN